MMHECDLYFRVINGQLDSSQVKGGHGILEGSKRSNFLDANHENLDFFSLLFIIHQFISFIFF